jgi:hypothetical protein
MKRVLGLLSWLLLPAEPLHELTHAAFAAPYADTSVRMRGSSASARLAWREGTPEAWVRVAHLAPTIIGVLLGVCAIPFLPVIDVALTTIGNQTAIVLGLPSLKPELRVLVSVSAMTNWLVFLWPSYSDRHPFS